MSFVSFFVDSSTPANGAKIIHSKNIKWCRGSVFLIDVNIDNLAQGLELAADCHLARITQATHLLQAPKHSADDIAAISGTCFKLNSLQLRALLINYQPQLSEGESPIPMQLINQVVNVAKNSADEVPNVFCL